MRIIFKQPLFSLDFSQFQPGIAYKSDANKKACMLALKIYEKIYHPFTTYVKFSEKLRFLFPPGV